MICGEFDYEFLEEQMCSASKTKAVQIQWKWTETITGAPGKEKRQID